MKKVVLIPCYNEELTIKKVITDFKKELPDADIYVYDNNSTDNTVKYATEAGAIIKYEKKQGKGNVVQSMFEQIDADIYIMVDGDDTYHADDVHKLIEPIINQNVDMVIGDRIKNGDYKKENKRKFHYSGNFAVKYLVNKLFKMGINDVMTGYRAFSKKFVKSIKLETTHFEIETEMTIKSKFNNMKIIEVPIKYSDRPDGSKSKLKTIKDGKKIISYTINQHRKNKIKKHILLKYIIVFCALIACYISSLMLISSFNSSEIKENCKQSANIIKQQWNDEYYGRLSVFIPYRQDKVLFDDPTDALMLNISYSIDNKTPFKSAMLGRKNYVQGITTKENADVNGRLISSNKYSTYLPADELIGIINDEPDESFEYVRYWHGYLVILRPLLLLFNINIIRCILLFVIAGLSIVLLTLINKKLGVKYTLLFFIGLLCTETFYVGMSLQGAPIFIIMLIQSILVLKRKKLSMLELFITGSLTNFFDFLTAPVITLGIPLLLYCLIQQKEDNSIKNKDMIVTIIKYSIIWFMGYALTWLSKWILVGAFCDRDIVKIVLSQIKHRSIGDIGRITYAEEFFSLLANLFRGPVIQIAFIIGIIAYVFRFIYREEKKKIEIPIKQRLINSIPFFVISAIPIVWAVVLKEHSFHHAFFTYRMLLVWLIPVMIGLFTLDGSLVRRGK